MAVTPALRAVGTRPGERGRHQPCFLPGGSLQATEPSGWKSSVSETGLAGGWRGPGSCLQRTAGSHAHAKGRELSDQPLDSGFSARFYFPSFSLAFSSQSCSA